MKTQQIPAACLFDLVAGVTLTTLEIAIANENQTARNPEMAV